MKEGGISVRERPENISESEYKRACAYIAVEKPRPGTSYAQIVWKRHGKD